jgi:chromosome partitioning protein
MRTAEPTDALARPMAGALVAVAGLKGGCGRTTLAVGLLGTFVGAGYRALLLDADRAGAACGWLGPGPLAAAVRARPIAAPAALRSWLEELQAARAAAELVLLDLPPADPVPLVAAALASDLVLLPVAPTGLELEAARSTLGWLERARARRGHDLPRLAVVPCRLAVLNPAARDHEDRLAPLGVALTPPLRLRPGHERGFAQGLPVGRIARGPGAAGDRALAGPRPRARRPARRAARGGRGPGRRGSGAGRLSGRATRGARRARPLRLHPPAARSAPAAGVAARLSRLSPRAGAPCRSGARPRRGHRPGSPP